MSDDAAKVKTAEEEMAFLECAVKEATHGEVAALTACLLAYADWCRDRDWDSRAYALEWMARREQFPRLMVAPDFPEKGQSRYLALWGRERRDSKKLATWKLDAELFDADRCVGFDKGYEIAAALALRKAIGRLAKNLRLLRDAVDLRRPS
jgi:hypothetical protein